MPTTVAGGGRKCYDFCGRRGFDEAQGKKPGGALCYYNPMPIGKITISGRAPGQDCAERLVEFLGEGQQLAAYGMHPDTGRPYEWFFSEFGGDPLGSWLEELPEVHPEKIRDAAIAVCDKLGEFGYTDLDISESGASREEAGASQRNGSPVTVEMLEEMLSHIDPACDRMTWIAMAGAIKSAKVLNPGTLEPDEDFDGCDLFIRWSAGDLNETHEPGNYLGPDDCERAFNSVSANKPGGATVGSIVFHARKNDYHGPARIPAIELLRGPAKAAGSGVDHGVSPDDTPQQEQQVQADNDFFPAYLVGELDQIPDPVWLIQDVLPEVSLGMTYGETGSLKTFLELDKALWCAVGKPWAANYAHDLEGFKVTRKLRTVIVAGEGARGLKRRVAAWAKRHGIKTDDLPVLVVPVMPRFANEGDLDKLIRTIKAKLPNPDYIIVDTAMWAGAGLNLNVPADSQVLLSSFKQVMLAFGCSLTFVHHIGKDKKRGHLGAEYLIAGVDVSDCIDLEEKGIGHRKIKITNKKMKDAELREPISMEAYPETLGTDEDGRTFGSLVLRRCHGTTKAKEADPRLSLALKIIAENKGKMSLNMNAMAEEMARRYATEELTAGELKKAKEPMRSYLRKEAFRGLAPYAHKSGAAKNAPWEFEDRRRD